MVLKMYKFAEYFSRYNSKNVIFSYPYMVEKVLHWGQIFEMEILMDLHVLVSPESENHIFSSWSVCVFVINITQNKL